MPIASALQNFFADQKGKVLCITDDPSLVKVIRFALTPYIKVNSELIHFHQDFKVATKLLETFKQESIPHIVFVEHVIQQKKTTDAIQRIARLYPKACLFVIDSKATEELTKYFYEMGIKAVIIKPFSADSILNKIISCISSSKEQTLISYVQKLIASAAPNEAIEAIDKYLSQNPNSSLAYYLKGNAFLSEGDIHEAESAYKKAMEISPEYIAPLNLIAALHKHVDDDKALAALQKIDSISPFNPVRKLEMAEIHLRNGDKEKAGELLETGYAQVHQEHPEMLSEISERIAEIASDKLPELSEKYLSKAIENKETFTELDLHLFNKLGMTYRDKGEWEKAIEVYHKAMKIAPNDPVLCYNAALAFHSGGDRANTLININKALNHDNSFYKNNEMVSYNLGIILFESGNKESACHFFEHVLEINPQNNKAKKKLKYCAEIE
jgi:tetratricopeptide (TPR) repeat protein